MISPLPGTIAEVSTASIRAALDSFALVPRFASILLARHEIHLESLGDGEFVPLLRWMSALEDIERQVGPATVRSIGTSAAKVLKFAPTVRSIEDALDGLPASFAALHRSHPGVLSVTRREDGIRAVSSTTRYPREYVFGLLEGVCSLPLSRSRRFVVTLEGTEWLVVGR